MVGRLLFEVVWIKKNKSEHKKKSFKLLETCQIHNKTTDFLGKL